MTVLAAALVAIGQTVQAMGGVEPQRPGHQPPGPGAGVRPGINHRNVVHQLGERQIGAHELVAKVVTQQLGGVLTRRRQAGEQIVQVPMVDPLKHLFGGPQRTEVPDHTDPIRWAG